jgi:hypothetical protein
MIFLFPPKDGKVDPVFLRRFRFFSSYVRSMGSVSDHYSLPAGKAGIFGVQYPVLLSCPEIG